MSIKLKYNYLAFFVVLFFTEVLIALYVHDDFIRPFFGDVLVVILIYCFLMSFLNISKIKIAVFVLLFAFGIELGQYCSLISILHLQNSRLARVVIGTSFAVEDLGCYLAGFITILVVEYWFLIKSNVISLRN